MTGRPVARRCIKLLADLRRAGALGYTPALWAWGQGLRAGRGGWAPAQPSSPMSPLPSPQRGSLPCSPSTLCSPRLRVVFLKHSPQYLLGWLCHLRSLLRSHFAGPSRPGSHLPVPCRSSNWVIRQGPGLGPRVPSTKDSAWSPGGCWSPEPVSLRSSPGGREGPGRRSSQQALPVFSPCVLCSGPLETPQERLPVAPLPPGEPAPWGAHVPDPAKLLKAQQHCLGDTAHGGQGRGPACRPRPRSLEDMHSPAPPPGKKLCPHLSGSPHRGKLRLTEVG